MQLPLEKQKPKSKDPKNLILFGLPKAGKTTITAQLPKALTIDLEDGSDFVEIASVKCKSVQDIISLVKAVKEAKCPYEFGIVDTATALEDLVMPLACKLYKETVMKHDPFIGNNNRISSLIAGKSNFGQSAAEFLCK